MCVLQYFTSVWFHCTKIPLIACIATRSLLFALLYQIRKSFQEPFLSGPWNGTMPCLPLFHAGSSGLSFHLHWLCVLGSCYVMVYVITEFHAGIHKCACICMYVVWQKSNETDFLLTMNFILFTNQGNPLQNSSLGQLHSDGGIVSIVRSSAGKLMLVYLSACRLCSSGYYPEYQMAPFQMFFEPGE